MVSHHATTFGGHEHSGSGDIMVLVFHVIFQEYGTKGSSNFMGRRPSR